MNNLPCEFDSARISIELTVRSGHAAAAVDAVCDFARDALNALYDDGLVTQDKYENLYLQVRDAENGLYRNLNEVGSLVRLLAGKAGYVGNGAQQE